MTSHPSSPQRPDSLVVGEVHDLPIVGSRKRFVSCNELTVLTAELTDLSGASRGAVVIGFSRHDRADGLATFGSIAETRGLIAMMENAIADAERIECGVAPLAVSDGEAGSALQ